MLTSLPGTLYLWVVDTITCIFVKRFQPALDLLYGFTIGCFLMPNAITHDLVTVLRLKVVASGDVPYTSQKCRCNHVDFHI